MGRLMKNVQYKALIVGGGYDYIRYFYEQNFAGAKSLDEADFLVFTGGEDVSPEFYNETKMPCTYNNIDRDREEKVFFDEAVARKMPMVGICRGGQFLNVMNGGRMWQDVKNHCGNHLLKEILPKGVSRVAETFIVTSTHHQMMRPHKSGVVLGVGVDVHGEPLCDSRISFGEEVSGKDGKKHPDIEVVWYPKTLSLCYQPHPEFKDAPKDCKSHFENLLDLLIVASV